MHPTHLGRHGYGHGHHKMIHRHGGRHLKFGHHFKHPDHHMEKEFFARNHHRGLIFERSCFSESELPDRTTQNVHAIEQDPRNCKALKEFWGRRYHWRYGRCPSEKNMSAPTDGNRQKDGTGNDSATMMENIEAGEQPVAAGSSTQNLEGNGTQHDRRGRRLNRSCQSYSQRNDDTTGTEATTDGEKEDNAKVRCMRKYHPGHRKGKKEHGFRKCCHDHCSKETSAATEDDEGANHWHLRKHHRQHRRHGYYGGNEHALRMFKDRNHRKGKWGHGSHKGRKGPGCCILMVDVGVNTGDIEAEINSTPVPSTQENRIAGPSMEQGANEEVSEGQVETGEADQVSEVADNLRNSSLQ